MFKWFKKKPVDNRASVTFFSDGSYELKGNFTYDDIVNNQLWLVLPTTAIQAVVLSMSDEDKKRVAEFSNKIIEERQQPKKEAYVSALNAYKHMANEVR